MGWFDRPKKKTTTLREVSHPGGGFESGVAAIGAIIRAHHDQGREGWASIKIPGFKAPSGKPLEIQVADQAINLLLEDVDHHLATRLKLHPGDHGLYTPITPTDAAGLAGMIDAIIREHYRVEGDYPVQAKLDG